MSTIDLEILHGQAGATKCSVLPGVLLSGTPKLMTRFATLFLSDFDVNKNRGTYFSQMFRQGQIRTQSDVVLRFSEALVLIYRQLGDQSGLPEAERLTRASLSSFSLDGDQLTLNVSLEAANGVTSFTIAAQKVPIHA